MRGLICDDHPLMRQALVGALTARWPSVRLEQASSFPEAWALAATTPDFCLIDLAMPGAEPVSGVARMREATPDSAIIVVTGLTDERLLRDVAACGVAAILPKTFEPADLLEAIQAATPLADDAGAALPTGRQREVLRLMGAGLTNKEIAGRLGIAPATVKIHVSRIIALLQAVNRTEAVSRAERQGLI